MTERDLISQTAVLNAALHNIRVARNQVESLNNPDDKSFEDLKMKPVYKEFQELEDVIEAKIKELDGKKGR